MFRATKRQDGPVAGRTRAQLRQNGHATTSSSPIAPTTHSTGNPNELVPAQSLVALDIVTQRGITIANSYPHRMPDPASAEAFDGIASFITKAFKFWTVLVAILAISVFVLVTHQPVVALGLFFIILMFFAKPPPGPASGRRN
ncbi:hypothetical protein B9Z65_8262 [Elsinoe australis]|uniref:Uncharacterized protein n=1 Tax=Elsinoe australis TaxID=40998 RepID=A0A2P7YD89_9PEZI|nr:hypothetical protein B9Z65_8262 [Elsinoe australis]